MQVPCSSLVFFRIWTFDCFLRHRPKSSLERGGARSRADTENPIEEGDENAPTPPPVPITPEPEPLPVDEPKEVMPVSLSLIFFHVCLKLIFF